MWPFTGTGATTRGALSLWRETNGLLRELVEAVKGSPALTARAPVLTMAQMSGTSSAGHAPHSTRPRKLQATDVTQNTRERLMELQQREQEKIQAPWRSAPEPATRLDLDPSSSPLPPTDPAPAASEQIRALSDPSAATTPSALGRPGRAESAS